MEETVEDGIPAPNDSCAWIENFENGMINFTAALNDLDEGRTVFAVAENPSKTGINKSNKVLKMTRNQAGTNAWSGFWATLGDKAKAAFDVDKYNFVHYKIYNDVAGAEAKFKIEGSTTTGATVEMTSVTAPLKVNEWEDLVFDLKGNGGAGHYNVIGIMLDLKDGRPAHSLYIDDIVMTTTNKLTTGIDNILSYINDVKVFVEGNQANVHFNMVENASVCVTIYNVAGNIISKQDLGQLHVGAQTVSSTVEGRGVFLVKVSVGNKSYATKFVK